MLAAEYLTGSTGMGDLSLAHVQVDIETAYLLASWQRGPWRTTLRYDTFETVDVDRTAADNNDEDGDAWTLALFWEPREALRLGLELLDVAAERPAAGRGRFRSRHRRHPCPARAPLLLRLVEIRLTFADDWCPLGTRCPRERRDPPRS